MSDQPAPLFTRGFLALTVAHFIQALGFSSLLLLPLYLEHLDASRAEIGTIMGSAAIGGLAFRPLVAWALDSIGRKVTIYAGTGLIVVGIGLLFWVRDTGWLLYASRIVTGAGIGALFTGYFTFASDLIPARRRTEGIALFGISGLTPLALTPFVDDLGVAAGDLRWFLPIVGLSILTSLFFVAPLNEGLVKRAPPQPGDTERRGLSAALGSLFAPTLLPVWLATIVFSGLVTVFFSFATVAAESRGMPDPAQIWLTYAGGAAAIRLFGARLPDRIGTSNLVAPAMGTYGVAALVVAGADTPEGFLLAGALAGLGHGYCFPVLTSQVVSRMPAHLTGSGLAMFTALWDVSRLALAPLFGAVADAFGDAAMFALAAIGVSGALAIWAVMEHRVARRLAPG